MKSKPEHHVDFYGDFLWIAQSTFILFIFTIFYKVAVVLLVTKMPLFGIHFYLDTWQIYSFRKIM